MLGDVVVDLATQRVRHAGGGEVRLTPRAVAVLRALIGMGDRPLSRDVLLSTIWAQAETGDEVVSKAINELRLALGDHDTRRRRFIETIPKLGYRLICTCRPLEPAATADAAAGETDAAAAEGVSGADGRCAAQSDHVLPPGTGDAAATGQPSVSASLSNPDNVNDSVIPVSEKSASRPRRSWRYAAVLLLAAGAILAWLLIPSRPASGLYSAPALRASLAQPPRVVATGREYLGYVDILPDASAALYASPLEATVRVVTRPFGSGTPRRVSALAGGAEFAPAVSHDGRIIAYQHFADGACRIRLHEVASGSERELAGCSSRFAEWLEFSPDGRFLLTPRMRPGENVMSLHRIDLADGSARAYDYPRVAGMNDVQARYAPDGRRLAIRRGAQPHSGLSVVDLRSGERRELVDDAFGLDGYTWLPDGSALLIGVHDGERAGLWRVDAETGEKTYLGLRGATCPVAARDALLYTHSLRRYALVSVAIGAAPAAAPVQAFAAPRGAEWFPRLSEDGLALAFLSDRDGPTAVHVGREDGRLLRLPDLPGAEPSATPALSADARRVFVPMRQADGHSGLYESATDAPAWRRVDSANGDVEQVALSPDEHWIYYVVRGGAEMRVLWRRSRETGAEQRIAEGLAAGPIACDRRGGVFYIDAARQALVRRTPDDGRSETWLDDMGYWTTYAWTLGNDAVYALREPGGRDFGLYRVGVAGATPVLVQPTDGIAALGIAVTPGEKRLLISQPPPGAQELRRASLPRLSSTR
nr:winged helix-turn-helix domain-containing protein [Tahibacter harae]